MPIDVNRNGFTKPQKCIRNMLNVKKTNLIQFKWLDRIVFGG